MAVLFELARSSKVIVISRGSSRDLTSCPDCRDSIPASSSFRVVMPSSDDLVMQARHHAMFTVYSAKLIRAIDLGLRQVNSNLRNGCERSDQTHLDAALDSEVALLAPIVAPRVFLVVDRVIVGTRLMSVSVRFGTWVDRHLWLGSND
jgi:hypothetical protein